MVEKGSCLLKDLGFLSAAILLPVAAVTEVTGHCVWVDVGGGDPGLHGRDGGWEAAEVDGNPTVAQQTQAAALAFRSAPHRPDGWTQPP